MSWARDVWPSERARLMSGHMMPIEREAVTVEELESWFDGNLPCEGVTHAEGLCGHVPEAGAAYRVRNSCGHSLNICASWVVQRTASLYMCGRCEAICRYSDMEVVPI